MMPSSCLLMLQICSALSNIIKTYVSNKHSLIGKYIIHLDRNTCCWAYDNNMTINCCMLHFYLRRWHSFCSWLKCLSQICFLFLPLFEIWSMSGWGSNPTYVLPHRWTNFFVISLCAETTDPFKTSLGIRPHSFLMMTHGIVLWWMFGETWQTVGATMLLLGSRLEDTLWHGK